MPRQKRTVPGFDPADSRMAWEAISVLRSKLPTMTKFARMVTGNDKLTVDITTDSPYTKGNRVYIRPPLGLSSKKEHERSSCGSRGSDGKQICPACQVREVIDFYLFHELAHVIGQTQALVTQKEINRARLEALRLHPEGCEHHRSVMNRIDYLKVSGCDAMTLGSAFNPWISMMINSLEDSRVNEMTFASRPGMRTIFNMNLERLLTEGSEIGDGKTITWIDAPLDSQFIVGLQIAASGYAFGGEFAPEVMDALADPKLVRLCQTAVQATDVFQIFTLCLEVHARAKELGFCELVPCVVEASEPELGSLGNPPEEDEGGGESGESGGDAQGDRSDREGDSGTSGAGGKGSPANDAGQSDSEPSGGGVDPSSGQGDSPAASDAESSSQLDDAGNSDHTPSDESAAPSPGADEPGDGSAGELRDDALGEGEADQPGDDADGSSPDGQRGTERGDESDGGGEGVHGAPEADDETVEPDSGPDGGSSPSSEGSPDQGAGSTEGSPSEGAGSAGEGTGGLDGPEPGEVPAPGDNAPSNGSANSPDDAGISGPDSQEGAASGPGNQLDQASNAHGGSDSDVRELESSVRNSGSEQVVRDRPDLAHEQRSGSESEPSAGDEGNRQDSDEPGERDTHERAEGDLQSQGDEDSDSAEVDRLENPWDVPHDERADVDTAPFNGPSGPVAAPTPVPMVHGTPDDAARALSKFLMHGYDDEIGLLDEMAAPSDTEPTANTFERQVGIPVDDQQYEELVDLLLDLAIKQVGMFDAPSVNVVATEKVTFPMRGIRWSPEDTRELQGFHPYELTTAFAPSEQLLGSVVLHARTVFDANKRSHLDRNRRSGRINTRVLGRRAPVGDDRLFAKKVVPKKRDYFVVLGGDASGSTSREARNAKIKRSVHAQAELLHRLNVPFAGYMHSAYYCSVNNFGPLNRTTGPNGSLLIWNYLLPFKEPNDQWNDEAKLKLASTNHVSQNLDGHTLEAYRKIAMESTATDRIVIYYTDGEMPAENKEEETEILLREIDLYKRHGIDLVCVGIQTDSPKRYGLPTVRVDSDEDIIKVIKFLDEILTKRLT